VGPQLKRVGQLSLMSERDPAGWAVEACEKKGGAPQKNDGTNAEAKYIERGGFREHPVCEGPILENIARTNGARKRRPCQEERGNQTQFSRRKGTPSGAASGKSQGRKENLRSQFCSPEEE